MRAAAAAIAVWLSVAAHASQSPPVEALRLAALAERIAKLHAQASHGVMPARSRRALADTLREFEAGLAASGRAAGADAREGHTLLAILWEEYRAWALKPPTPDTTRKLADRADEVAWVAARPAREWKGPPSAAMQAARAALLAQRVPRLHLMRRSDARNEELARELAARTEELARIFGELTAPGRNSAEIAAELQVAETQHAFLARAARELPRGGAAATQLEHIAKAGDHILESMSRLARLYEAAGL